MLKRCLKIICCALVVMLAFSFAKIPSLANMTSSTFTSFPCKVDSADEELYEYLYLTGGYHSVDNGCPAWGTADNANARFIGDKMGQVVITYKDGSKETVPLIFGYTMWFHANWQEASAPFKGENADKDLTDTLKSVLSLNGAFEGEEVCVLRIKLAKKPVSKISIEDNNSKVGNPVFLGALLVSNPEGSAKVGKTTFNTNDKFFDSHTIDSSNPLPDSVTEALNKINHALLTYEEDYQAAAPFVYPADWTGERVTFTGNSIANIASGVIYNNVKSILDRIDANGMFHTSYAGAPSWRYDGFGYWVEKADSYYSSYYSRDGGRALMTLCSFGYISDANRSVDFANGQMMYFPNNKLTLKGQAIPGHFTVVLNKPLLYSETLVPTAGWPTQYTKAKFGDEYKNIGNPETDGHGLMMLAEYDIWKNLGSPKAWVDSNWTYIKEAAKWIEWSFENPELSFAKDGLLYAESEAGMKEYTLYCNVPCMLGMYAYAEMAETAGFKTEADSWKNIADKMKNAIEKKFLRERTKSWNATGFGFYHDPVITMLADVYGYNLSNVPEEFASWVTASRNSYADDAKTVVKEGYFGASGIGYNHSMITQNALLTDNMADASKLVENLCRISYAPKLPDPYIVPEGITYDSTTGAVRRQGDLGNLVQAAEAMKVFDIVMGINPVLNGKLDITPRLPEGWTMFVEKHNVQNSDAIADVAVSYPENGRQFASIKLDSAEDDLEVAFRFGPLPADTKCVAARVNGKNASCSFELIGDSAWATVTFKNDANVKENKLVLIYAEDASEIGKFPSDEENPLATPEVTNAPTSAPSQSPDNPNKKGCASAISIESFVIIALAAVVLAVTLKKGKKENA